MENITIPQEFFDELSCSSELRNYELIAKAFTEILNCFQRLEFGDLTPELMKQFHEGNYDVFGKEYCDLINRQSKDIKNMLLKRNAIAMANDEFAKFKQQAIRILSISRTSMTTDLDYSLFDITKDKVTVTSKQVEFLKEKHTIKPNTDKQKEYVSLCQNVVTAIENLESFLEPYKNFDVIGGAFWIDNDGIKTKLKYDPSSVEVIK